MKMKVFIIGILFFCITGSVLLGCAGKGKGIKTVEGDPEILYKKGLILFNKREYPDALKKFEQLKSNFPDSPPYTYWAEIKAGDCHFLNKDYVEAIAAYEEFKKVHPTHEEIPYVQYQIGMSHFNQMLSPDRDQGSTKKAIVAFEYLIANYPPSIFTEKAKEKIGACKKQLADQEFYIGDFYYKQGKFRAASVRFEGLLEKFPKMAEEDKTLFFLGKSYLEIDQVEKARQTFTKIVDEYPKSFYYKEAKGILDQGVKKIPPHQAKAKESKKRVEKKEADVERVALAKVEEEGRHYVSLQEEKRAEYKRTEEKTAYLPAPSESAKVILPKEEMKKAIPLPTGGPMEEDRVQAIPLGKKREEVSDKDLKIALIPKEEPRKATSPQPKKERQEKLNIQIKPDEAKRTAALPMTTAPPKEKEKPKKEAPQKGVSPEAGEAKLVDKGQPIDITSDRVETFSKENLIVFKGNVMARQKDIVIYADSIEASIIEDGKGIEKVVAGGNVKIQQGLRVANCQKAVFYNLDQKVILTGDPKVWEGENLVSGDEILFDIEQNRIEVKGGASGRGKAKIHPESQFEKLK